MKNYYGQLATVSSGQPTPTPAGTGVLKNLRNIKQIAGDTLHTCALLNNGQVKCWGGNTEGDLGNGTESNSVVPGNVIGINNAIAITGGIQHMCALLSDHTIKCWGANGFGQLGDGSTTSRYVPVNVLGINNAIAVTAGENHTCALLNNNTVKCWGDNAFGELGNATSGSTPVAQAVTVVTSDSDSTPLANVTAITAGGNHTCALLHDNTMKCWGKNYSGEIGNGSLSSNPITAPTSVITTHTDLNPLANISAISAGVGHTCALLTDTTIKCWGANDRGQLGAGSIHDAITAPVSVIANPKSLEPLTNVAMIDATRENTCALLNNKTVKCWGDNSSGQIGDGTTKTRRAPIRIPHYSNVIAVTTMSDHTCAILTGQRVKCWGDNRFGQIGDGTTTSRFTPTTVITLDNISPMLGVQQVTGGFGHSCALLITGHIKCWGDNEVGQLGDGTGKNSLIPVDVTGIDNAIAISSGFAYNCALLSDHTLKCWGVNTYGQLGDNSTTARLAPVNVTGIQNAVAVTTGELHTCALLNDQSMKCWGDNSSGQLGNGSTSSTPVTQPVSVVTSDRDSQPLTNVYSIMNGYGFTCALLYDKTVKCWGDNSSGALGNGSTVDSNTPVTVKDINTATSLTAGQGHVCALLDDKTIRCWGLNNDGQLGNGSATIAPVSEPVTVISINNAVAITAGLMNTCALLSDNTMKCWGNNLFGELGDGSMTTSFIPVTVTTIGGAGQPTIGPLVRIFGRFSGALVTVAN